MQIRRTLAACLLFVAALGTELRADSLHGYTRHLWQSPDGLPEQTVQSFAQTRDGYLWIGTTGGLLRFDGARFTLYDRQSTPALEENSIFCLMVSRDGALWIGTEGGGLTRLLNGQFRTWSTREGLSNDFVRALAQDAAGTIWAGTDNGLLRLEGEHFVRVDRTDSIPAIYAHSIYPDREGRLWVGGFHLQCLQNGLAREYSLGSGPGQNQIKSVLQTRDGTVWVGTVAGLNRMLPGQDHFEPVTGVDSTVRILRQTAEGALWIGTIGQGAFVFEAGKLTHLSAPEQLPSNTVLNFFEDSERNFWIGTQTGMVRLTRSPVSIVPLPVIADSDFGTVYQDRDASFWIGSSQLFKMRAGAMVEQQLPGMQNAHVRNVFRDRSGALWAGTDGDGVFRIAEGHTTHFASLTNGFIRAMIQDRDGSMWVATDGGVNHILSDAAGWHIVQIQVTEGLAYSSTRALLQDRHGDLWIGTDRGLSHMHEGKFVSDAATEALAQRKIWAIHEDEEGDLWLGTRNNGLYRYRDGRIAHFTAQDGLASNAIYQILEDHTGHLWLSGPNGITLLNRQELDEQAEAPVRHFALIFYSISQMESNTEIYGGTQPSGCITTEGDVWFPSNRGPIHILPLLRTVLSPPPLRIQATLADGFPLAGQGRIVLQPNNSRLEIVYSPIRLRSQDGLRFRYRLEGFDHDWSASTAVRTADYTNLPPGKYHFRVQTFEVGNPDAVAEASIDVVQKPHFYRTWWFITSSVLLCGLLIYAFYQNRVRQVRARFEAVLEERSRLAREMHDTVIQGCTGVSALIEALSMKSSDGGGLLDFARQQLRSTINEARDAIWNLRQPDKDTASISDKLESMTTQVSLEFNLPVVYTVTGSPFALSHPMAHDLLMVAREAVFNAVLHGKPSTVEVTLAYSANELILSVHDDGSGFDEAQLASRREHHFGLRGMKERIARSGGTFLLQSEVGKGVSIEARLPRRDLL